MLWTYSELLLWALMILKLIGCILASLVASSGEINFDSATEGSVLVNLPN